MRVPSFPTWWSPSSAASCEASAAAGTSPGSSKRRRRSKRRLATCRPDFLSLVEVSQVRDFGQRWSVSPEVWQPWKKR
jgi:hypothetical protein